MVEWRRPATCSPVAGETRRPVSRLDVIRRPPEEPERIAGRPREETMNQSETMKSAVAQLRAALAKADKDEQVKSTS